jgi:hypothetical protein
MKRSARIALLLLAAAAVPGAAIAQEAPVGVPGLRIVSGQSAVIGGNAAGARERALDEAFRQAVDQALAELLDAPTRAAQAKAIRALEGRARSYVRRYRALEEGEAGGAYTVKLEAEVDEPALRRAAERWGAPTGPAAAPVAPGVLVVAGAEAGAAATPLLAALVNAGVRAQLAPDAATAAQAAARATLPQIAFLTAEATPEGAVRGTAELAVACKLRARVVAAASGLVASAPPRRAPSPRTSRGRARSASRRPPRRSRRASCPRAGPPRRLAEICAR